MDEIKVMTKLYELVYAKLEECYTDLRAGGTLNLDKIEVLDKLAHTAKCLKTIIAMTEGEEEGGQSMRSYAREGSNRSREGGSYEGSYEGGASGRRGRSPRTGRYVSREGGYSGHGGIEDILEDVEEMTESEKRKLKAALERM